MPLESIIDVVTTDIWAPSYDQHAPCATKVQRSLDRLETPLVDVYFDVSISMQRRVLRTGPGGFPLLQDVGVSFADFTVAARSPGWIAKLFPTYYLFNPVVEVSQNNAGLREIGWDLLILLALIIAMTAVVIMVGRRKALQQA